MQILRELRAEFAYVLILLALAEKENLSNIMRLEGVPPMFFRNDMILICLSCTLCNDMILNWLLSARGRLRNRRIGAKSIRAALLGRVLRSAAR